MVRWLGMLKGRKVEEWEVPSMWQRLALFSPRMKTADNDGQRGRGR